MPARGTIERGTRPAGGGGRGSRVGCSAAPYHDPVPERPGSDLDRPLSALPSPGARALAFVAILVGGFAGGLIGYTLVKIQCDGECATERGLGAFSGAVIAAGGMSVVAVLVLRALGEWRQISARERQQRSGATR
jgi:hypothetical protein